MNTYAGFDVLPSGSWDCGAGAATGCSSERSGGCGCGGGGGCSCGGSCGCGGRCGEGGAGGAGGVAPVDPEARTSLRLRDYDGRLMAVIRNQGPEFHPSTTSSTSWMQEGEASETCPCDYTKCGETLFWIWHLFLVNGVSLASRDCPDYVAIAKAACASYESCADRARVQGLECPPAEYPTCLAPAHSPPDDLCEELRKCRMAWAAMTEDSPQWIRQRRTCMVIRARIRSMGMTCPERPERRPFDESAAGRNCNRPNALSKRSPRACDYGDNDVMQQYGCSWALRCVCLAFPDSAAGMCMRACVACLRDSDNNYGEDGHLWCRRKCDWKESDRERFLAAARQCIRCPDPIYEALALQFMGWLAP